MANSTTAQTVVLHPSGGGLFENANPDGTVFSPMLAEHFDEESQSYSCVNWDSKPIPRTSKVLDSPLLCCITQSTRWWEMESSDQMMYNFGDDNISFINVPWGGVRHSNLGETFISNPDHSYEHVDGLYGATLTKPATPLAG